MCAQYKRMDAILDAVEWELQNAPDFARYQLIKNSSRGEVRVIQVMATATTAGVVVVFGFEDTGGDHKVLLLDAWVPEEDP